MVIIHSCIIYSIIKFELFSFALQIVLIYSYCITDQNKKKHHENQNEITIIIHIFTLLRIPFYGFCYQVLM